jgi:glyoxylate/hydroxypyruvate reductase A
MMSRRRSSPPVGDVLLVKSGGEAALGDWQRWFAAFAPGLDVRWWHDATVDPHAVRYVLVWEPEPGRLATLPKLEVVFSSAAGVDHITRDPTWPAHLPLIRMGTDEIAQRMGEYVCLGALGLMRGIKRILANQATGTWEYFETDYSATDLRAGVMGMGNLGQRGAAMLRALGFRTAGWSTTRKTLDGVESFAGAGEFDAFLARTDILVCLLPDTPATSGVINAATIARLPPGAAVINAGRGSHVVLPDLIAALDAGHLSGAMLDVFTPEPFPADEPAWAHPKIIVTPHLAAFGSRREKARYVAAAIAAYGSGETLPNRYDAARGY